MNINFELILVLLTAGTGVFWLAGKLYQWIKKTEAKKWLVSVGSFFPILLLVLVIRGFIFEPFRIPSGSLKPTLDVGDFIIVNKFDYGLRWPLTNKKIINTGEPKVGDIVVFYWPANPSIYFIKRVVAVPGDRLSYINKELYINGKPAKQTLVGQAFDNDQVGDRWLVNVKREDLLGVKHDIWLRS
ncbi:MAG: signal peptidase I, partial [Pseudomonadota bacterium]